MAVREVQAATALLPAALLLLAVSTVQISGDAPAARTARAGSAAADFCAVAAPVHLPTPASESTLQLHLTSSPKPRPCRRDVTVPLNYELGITLVAEQDVEEDDDAVDQSQRLAVAAIFQAGIRPENRKTTNYGRMYAEALIEHASRQGNNVNASCTLALYIKDEMAWSADLCDEKSVQANKPHLPSSVAHNLSLTWTPPQKGRVPRFSAVVLTAVRKGLPTDNLCTAETVLLAGKGIESAIALELRDRRPAEDRVGPCRVSVAAPPGYQLSLLLVNKGSTAPTAATSASSVADVTTQEVPTSEPSCRLSLMPGCTVLFDVDLCKPTAAANLNYSEWSPNNVTLEWEPPHESQSAAQVADTVILTAVGRGEMCKHAHFAACQHRPRFQHFCVAAELACDGHPNCPNDGRDEDAARCRTSAGLIETPRQDRQDRPDDAKDLIMDLLRWQGPSRNATHPPDAIPDTLSNYGPWGYLMLGMLVCGAFLMLCGLWECCCRQPKAPVSAPHPSHTPTTVLMPQMGATGGVLVLDSDLEDDPSRPPAYDDLDQPPAYGALFPPGVLPGQPKDDVIVPASSLAASLAASLDVPFADDAASLYASTSSMATASSMSLS